ncbi:MAG: HlyD family efflux transporter periplasmic adaptor subunit [Sulfobacillus sp.]|nr:HlyD family efflux transporter periplasmic adaptor subunit [Sulfobacillus sp.]
MPRWLFPLVVILGLISVGGTFGWYTVNNVRYVTTTYASVTAPTRWITAPEAGHITADDVTVGQSVSAGETLLTETLANGTPLSVTAPANGVVATMNAPRGQWVAAGTPLLAVVNPAQYQVTANIPETQMANVWVGQTAVIRLSAYPGTRFSGQVVRIGTETLSVNPAVLSASTTFSKQVQWVPVTLTINAPNTALWPGENATVKIRR